MKNLLDTEVVLKSNRLEGKQITFCVGGGIAAVETVKTIRELRRHGGEVRVFMSQSAQKFITPLSLEWASGRSVITDFSGSSDHLFRGDLLLVAPATANLISRVASGISDDLITSIVASALGLKTRERNLPIVFFPTMHQTLFKNPFLQNSLESLKKNGVLFVEPREEEGKMKIPSPEEMTVEVIRSNALLAGDHQSVLITGGTVPSYLDKVRFLSNRASGDTSIALAKALYQEGRDPILLLHEEGVKRVPPYLQVEVFRDFEDYLTQIFRLLEKNLFSWAVFTAGVADFKNLQPMVGKKDSRDSWDLTLTPNPKVIQLVKEKFPRLKTIVFKLQSEVGHEALFQSMNHLLQKGHQYVVGNLLEELEEEQDKTRAKRYWVENSKALSGYSSENFSDHLLKFSYRQELIDRISLVIRDRDS